MGLLGAQQDTRLLNSYGATCISDWPGLNTHPANASYRPSYALQTHQRFNTEGVNGAASVAAHR
jgi:hypothetical protein